MEWRFYDALLVRWKGRQHRETLPVVAASRRKNRYRSAPRRSPALAAATERLADKIRSLRGKETQQAVSERASIEVKHWQVLEAGGGNPTLATLLAVSKALGVEVHELLH